MAGDQSGAGRAGKPWLAMRQCAACGHPREAHTHLRRGTECSQCDCTAFRWFKVRRR